MATTTNYAWETPDDTDLVKDGAAAIRTLGSSIDTTTKALNPSTTLGDIEYRSSTANTNTRLAIGSTGNVLTVAGGVPTWAAPSGGAAVTHIKATGSTTSLTNGANVKIAYTTEDYDTLSEWASNRFTAINAGYYLVTSSMPVYGAATANGSWYIKIYKNGSLLASTTYGGAYSYTTRNGIHIATTVKLAASDYIEMYFQNDMFPTTTPNDGGNSLFLTIDRLQD